MDPEEDDSKDIYIVHLKKKGAITKVKEFVHDPKCKKYHKFKIIYFIVIHVGIIKDLFYYASENVIKIIDIRKEVKEEGDKVRTEINDEEVVEIDVT